MEEDKTTGRRVRRPEADKRKARDQGREALDYVNLKNVEIGKEKIGVHEGRDDNKTITKALEEAKRVDEKKTKELKKLNNAIAKDIKGGVEKLNENKLELTRSELQAMGIELKSNIAFGRFAKLSDEHKELFNKELSGAILEKAIKLLNECFDESKIEKAGLKDSAIAFSILVDKMRLLDGKADKTVQVTHSLSSLINKNSEKTMKDIDFGAVIDAEIVEPTDDEV